MQKLVIACENCRRTTETINKPGACQFCGAISVVVLATKRLGWMRKPWRGRDIRTGGVFEAVR